jgi:4-amino-4-deoxy-L-arabinose transferase-like glycosyltransferase
VSDALTIWRERLFWTGFAVLLVGSLWLRVQRLDSYPWDYDEGIFLMFGRLIAAGYYPYSEVVLSYLPPFPLTVALFWRLFQSVSVIRLALAVLALVSVASLGLLVRRLVGGLAGLMCIGIVSFQADFFWASRAVMADVPALSIALLAIVGAWMYAETGGRHWLLGAVLGLTISLMTKFLVAFVAPLCLLLIVWRWLRSDRDADHQPRQVYRLLVDAGISLAALSLPVILVVLFFDPHVMMTQAIEFNILGQVTFVKGNADAQLLTEVALKAQVLLRILTSDLGLVALATWGIVSIVLLDNRRTWPAVAWLFLATLSLLFDERINPKHAVILTPPMAVAAAVGLSCLWRNPCPQPRSRCPRLLVISCSVIVAVAWIVLLPGQMAKLSPPPVAPIEGRAELVEFIRENSFASDCVITDEPAIALAADRLTPPEMAETSEDLILSGRLPDQVAIAITESRDCPVVVSSKKRRFEKLLPGYVDWVRSHYVVQRDFGHDVAFVIRRGMNVGSAAPVAEIGDARFQLWDCRLEVGTWKAGGRVPVRLCWRTSQWETIADHKIFFHVRDQRGETVAQADHFFGHGLLDLWPPGDILADRFVVNLPAQLAAGDYVMAVGIYCPSTGERLPVVPDTSGENAVVLGSVRVEAAANE